MLKELEDYAATRTQERAQGQVSYADLELARAQSAAYGESFPLDVEMTPEQEAQLDELTDDMMRKNEKVWAAEPRAVRKKAEAIAANLPMAESDTSAALNPDAQAGIINQMTELRRSRSSGCSPISTTIAAQTHQHAAADRRPRQGACRTHDQRPECRDTLDGRGPDRCIAGRGSATRRD